MTKNYTAYNEMVYKFHRNKIKHEIEKAEWEFYSKLLNASKGNMRKTNIVHSKNYYQQEELNRIQTEFKNGGSITV